MNKQTWTEKSLAQLQYGGSCFNDEGCNQSWLAARYLTLPVADRDSHKCTGKKFKDLSRTFKNPFSVFSRTYKTLFQLVRSLK